MPGYTTRDLFLNIMDLGECERTLNWEFGYWGGALTRWYEEGLPKVKGLPREVGYGESIHGPGLSVGSPSYGGDFPIVDVDVSSYFDFDEGFASAPYNYWIYPHYEPEKISEDDEHIELYDIDGIRKRVFKNSSSMPFWIEWPVKTRKDWEKMKEERFRLDSIDSRYAGDRDKFIHNAKNRTYPLCLLDAPAGFFGSVRFLVGEKDLFLLYYDDPKLIHDILSHLCSLWIEMAEELTAKVTYDIACFWEDMSGKHGSLISPAMFREFMTPNYRRIVDYLRTKKIKYFLVDTDGEVSELIPLFLEAGINVMYPFEQQAGNDLLEIRRKHPQLRMLGGFDKNTLYKGRKEIDNELEKMPLMIRQGGYIPYADHLIPANSTWDNFEYYRERLKDIIDTTPVRGTAA